MKKIFRVKKNEDFQFILKSSEYFVNRQFVVYYIFDEGNDNNHFKCGISVGKKLGHAVIRNRIKRKIRVSIQKYKNQIPTNIRMVIIARKGCLNIPHEQFENGLHHLLVNAKIIGRT